MKKKIKKLYLKKNTIAGFEMQTIKGGTDTNFYRIMWLTCLCPAPGTSTSGTSITESSPSECFPTNNGCGTNSGPCPIPR